MSAGFPHLLPNAALIASRPGAERLEYLYSASWVSYDRSEKLLRKLSDLVARPRSIRMPGCLVVGASNNGKSALVSQFLAKHPCLENRDGEHVIAPVLVIEAPPTPKEEAVYDAIYHVLCSRNRIKRNLDEKRSDIVNLIAQIQLRVLVVEEINSIIAGSISEQRKFLYALKYLSNQGKISIVAAGTESALRVVQTDPQMASRLPPQVLPRWTCNEDYRTLLANFEEVLPLREASNLSTSRLGTLIHSRTDATIGSTIELLRSATEWAIAKKQEKITPEAILSCDYSSPADLKKQEAHV